MLFTLGAYGVAAGAATGEEAVVAVGVFAFTLFVVGIVWPVAALARLDVEAVAPTDATVGDSVQLRVKCSAGRRARRHPRARPGRTGGARTSSPASGTLTHVAARRGVFRVVRMQLRTSAPLGVFVRTRTLRVRAAGSRSALRRTPAHLGAGAPAGPRPADRDDRAGVRDGRR